VRELQEAFFEKRWSEVLDLLLREWRTGHAPLVADAGRYQYTPKKGVTFTLTAEALVRLVSLVPPAKAHLTSFHGVYAPHATRG
jgi:hypothetical protein